MLIMEMNYWSGLLHNAVAFERIFAQDGGCFNSQTNRPKSMFSQFKIS